MEKQTVTDSVMEWLLAAAEWGGEGITREAIEAGLRAGDHAVVHSDRAAVLTQALVTADGKPLIHLLLVGGHLDGVGPLLEQIERVAREHGAHKITAVARPGWRAFAKSIGYRMEAVHYSKDL